MSNRRQLKLTAWKCIMNFMASRAQLRSSFYVALFLCLVGAVQAQNSADPAAIASSKMSASSPKVTYVNGQLSIRAQDASLGDVLRAVSVKTGAVIEFPADRAQERLFANAGPGPVREVLSAVLNGSHFNYVMLASPGNPNILQRMILTSDNEPANQAAPEQQVQAAIVAPVAAAPVAAQEIQKGLTPEAAADSAAIEAMEAPKEPLSSDALEAMMKARRDARRAQREQEAASGTTSSQ
jgi:hypothetical protein